MKILVTEKGPVILNENQVDYVRILELDGKYYVRLHTPAGTVQPLLSFETREDAVKWILSTFPEIAPVTAEYYVYLQKIITAEPHRVDGKIISWTVSFANHKLSVAATWLLPEFIEQFPELKELM